MAVVRRTILVGAVLAFVGHACSDGEPAAPRIETAGAPAASDVEEDCFVQTTAHARPTPDQITLPQRRSAHALVEFMIGKARDREQRWRSSESEASWRAEDQRRVADFLSRVHRQLAEQQPREDTVTVTVDDEDLQGELTLTRLDGGWFLVGMRHTVPADVCADMRSERVRDGVAPADLTS